MYYVRTFFLVIISIGHAKTQCTSSSERTAEARLREKLFCNYNKTVRPVKNFSDQTVIEFQLWPSRIYMDHYYEVFSVHGNVFYSWQDVFLSWDPREYEGIDFIRVSTDEIWVPDITIDSPTEFMEHLFKMSSIDCHLVPSGKIYCFPIYTLQSHCSPDMTRYPYDIQNCTLIFCSIGYMGNHLNISFANPNKGIEMNLYKPNKVWEVVSYKAARVVKYLAVGNSTFYPYIKCNFILRRHAAAYIAMLVVPAIGLLFSTLLTFLMGSMYNQRIMVCAVTMVSDVLYLIYFGTMLPSNGDDPIIIVTFFRDSFVMSLYGLMVAVLSKCLTSKSNAPYDWVSGSISKIESTAVINFVLLTNTSPQEEDTVNIMESATKEKITPWHQLATLIDRLSFIICSLAFIILFSFYLP